MMIQNSTHHKTPFCVINQKDKVTFIQGKVIELDFIQELENIKSAWPFDSISLIPFSQIREKGFMAHHDNENILTLIPEIFEIYSKADFLKHFGRHDTLELAHPCQTNLSNQAFESIISQVISQCIEEGEGSNFLLSRKTLGSIKHFNQNAAFSILTRFIENEPSSYMNFLFYDGKRYFIGASPEMHVCIDHNRVRVNPICGTLPKQDQNLATTKAQLLNFLQDPKEINELFQVVDETMKIMTKVCQEGGQVKGPFLKEMRTLFHTHYELEGISTLSHLSILRHSMYAPTMIGSPLENAARIIYQHEQESRRYYSSVLLIKGKNNKQEKFLDSGITIRTLEIEENGDFTIQSGASIVRDSIPEKERIETETKALSALKAISETQASNPILKDIFDTHIKQILDSRNNSLSTFWLNQQTSIPKTEDLNLKSILILDNEDEFSYMLAHMLRSLGFQVRVENTENMSTHLNLITEDLIILGPGPGNPNKQNNPRIQHLLKIATKLLTSKRPFLAVCLGHQIIMKILGFDLKKLKTPLQGVQVEVDFYGKKEKVGFYNTFAAIFNLEKAKTHHLEIAHNQQQHIFATRGPHFATFQFHVESILTRNGVNLLFEEIKRCNKVCLNKPPY